MAGIVELTATALRAGTRGALEGGALVLSAGALLSAGAMLGFRQLTVGSGLAGPVLGIVFAILGTWVLRSRMRVVEVEQLARFMTVGLEERGEEA